MAVERCLVCGKNLALVGRVHNCVPMTRDTAFAQDALASFKPKPPSNKIVSHTVYVNQPCPVCELRRAKKAAAQRRYRAKAAPDA